MPNGFAGIGCALPFAVIAKAFAELSMNWLLWQVSSEVFAIAVSGAVGGKNMVAPTVVLDVWYWAGTEPFTARRFEMLPFQKYRFA
jgi:hypothetical protein